MSRPVDELATLTADLHAWLDWQVCLGGTTLPREKLPPRTRPEPAVQRTAPRKPVAPAAPVAQPAPIETPSPRLSTPEGVKATPGESAPRKTSSKWAAYLDGPPTHRVSGPNGADLMIIRGTGSSAEAEQMLDKMIANVLRLSRTEVAVVDLTRDTRPADTIGSGLMAAMGELKPARVLLMGTFSVQAILGSDRDVRSCRGQWLELSWDDGAAPLRVTHHPEAIIALEAKGQTAPKREAFQDLQAVASALSPA